MVELIFFRFLLAQFQLNYILGFARQPKKLVPALTHLPPTMPKIYDEIMQRIKDSEPEELDLAVNSLSWVFYTASCPGARSLRMDELLALLATDIGDKELTDERGQSSSEDVLEVCRGLIVVDNVTKTIRFAHLTVLEYFRSTKYLQPCSYIAQVSITYLDFDEFETECKDWAGVRERLEKYKAADLIANYWGHYTRGAQEDKAVQDCVFGWLSSEKKCRSMMQMQLFLTANPNPDEMYYDWDWLEWKLRDKTIVHVLTKHGLDILCDSFLDGKSVVAERYELYKPI
jgi:hypothetical protein